MDDREPRRGPKKAVRQAKQARSKNTVEAILEAATRILAKKGWPGFNTNAVAETAGVSVGSVYEYFEHKEAIISVIVDRHLSFGEARMAGLASLAHATLSLDEIVQLLVRGFVDLHSDDPRLHRVLSGEVPLSKEQRSRIDQIRTNAISLLTGFLTGQVENPEMKATMMMDAADALTHRWFVDELGIPASPETMTLELQRMLRAYLAQ